MTLKNFKEPLLIFLLPLLSEILVSVIDGVFSITGFLISYILFFSSLSGIYAIFKNFTLGFGVLTGFGGLLSFISYAKESINGTPLTMNDLAFADNLGEIASFAISQIKLSFPIILAIIIFLLSVILLGIFEKRIPKRPQNRAFAGIFSIILVFLLFFPKTSAGFSKILDTSKISSENLVMKFGTLSGLYLSYSQDNEFYMDKDTTELKKSVNALEISNENISELNPTVIFLMSESFFDVNRLENVSFSKNPVATFHKLKESFSSGDFVSSAYCGGTGFVEMEVLTGLCSYYLKNSDNLTTFPNDKYKNIPSITDMFIKRGYELTFLHSYSSVLYNRENIYTALGFDNILFDNSFPENAQRKGGYISDEALADEIIRLYNEKGEKPMMLFAISMENHQPYPADKFEKLDIDVTSEKLSDEEIATLSTCIQGIYDADKSLKKLTDYFESIKAPVVLVFWGDHLPNLSTKTGNVYQKLGYLKSSNSALCEGEELLKLFTTDYVIWDNFSMKKEDKTIASSMLGVEVLNRLGFEFTDYYNWLFENVRDNYILYRPRLFVPNENEVYSEIPEKYFTMMKNYSLAVFDILYGKEEIFTKYRQ